MTDYYSGPFITQVSATALTDLALSGYDATATTKLKAAITALKTLINQSAGSSSYHPDFNKVSPAFIAKLNVELDAIHDAITVHV